MESVFIKPDELRACWSFVRAGLLTIQNKSPEPWIPEDVYADFWSDRKRFDNSGQAKDSPFCDTTNKKVIGKMKDEAGGVPITEFVGLRSKMYSYIKADGGGGKTARCEKVSNKK